MTITYPLTHPAAPSFRKLTLYATTFTAQAVSSFTMQSQRQRQPGNGWGADVDLPPLTRDQAAPWWDFLTSLRGEVGTFWLGDPLTPTPRGVATGTPVTSGATAAGAEQLVITGMTPSTGNIWRGGDYIQIGQRLYMILGSHNSDGFGTNTVPVFPTIREPISAGTSIITVNPKGLFRLTTPTISWSGDISHMYAISFSAIEDL
jgi:hypothetical protein